MQTFIGTKIIKAEPEARDGKPGWLVEYGDGYQSWSPAKAFEDAYQPLDAMSFGHAIEMMKRGERVAREGWNGKGMWVSINWGSRDPSGPIRPMIMKHGCLDGIPLHLFNDGDTGTVTRFPHFVMRTAHGATLTGWSATQTDMLAEDWRVLGEEV